MAGSPVHNRIGAVFVPVSDIHRSAGWYARLLGCEAPALSHGDRICDLPMAGDAKLILDAHRPVATSSQPLCFFTSDDIRASRRHLDALGAAVVREVEDIGSMWTLTFEDPDGNLLMVCQPRG